MTKGKVKWYNEVRGFGFIEAENGVDIFVHRTSLVRPYGELHPEQEVVFETKQSDKGLIAINVKATN